MKDFATVPLLMRPYFIGIGGAGMSALAKILAIKGAVVSGSDMRESAEISALRAVGVSAFVGHDSSHVQQSNPTVVIISQTAIADDNVELVYARNQGIPVLYRSELLAMFADFFTSIAVTGTHGKTSTTAMIITMLLACGIEPSYAVGGIISSLDSGSGVGKDDIFVFEADESDGSLINYHPHIAVITNIDPDHLDYFGTVDAYLDVYVHFLLGLPEDSIVIINVDTPLSQKLLCNYGVQIHAKKITIWGYSCSQSHATEDELPQEVLRYVVADLISYSVEGSTNTASIRIHHDQYTMSIGVPGVHMISNAIAALLVAHALSMSPIAAIAGLSTYQGTKRRFELRGMCHDIAVYDDYAHHPTEIAAVLTSAQALHPMGRVGVVFQPHLYSRTQIFAADFARALSLADQVWILDIYPARESPIAGVTSALITQSCPSLEYCPEPAQIFHKIIHWAQPHDVIITMGAGDVTMLGPQIVACLTKEYAQ